jgi:hypothetical protein
MSKKSKSSKGDLTDANHNRLPRVKKLLVPNWEGMRKFQVAYAKSDAEECDVLYPLLVEKFSHSLTADQLDMWRTMNLICMQNDVLNLDQHLESLADNLDMAGRLYTLDRTREARDKARAMIVSAMMGKGEQVPA